MPSCWSCHRASSPAQPTLDNYVQAVTTNQFGRYFLNSMFVAVSSTIITVILSALLAYGFARWDFPGRQFMFFSMLGTMMIPSLVLIIPQFVLAKNLHLLNSLWGLVVVYSAGTALNMFLLRGAFEELPQDLFELRAHRRSGPFHRVPAHCFTPGAPLSGRGDHLLVPRLVGRVHLGADLDQ